MHPNSSSHSPVHKRLLSLMARGLFALLLLVSPQLFADAGALGPDTESNEPQTLVSSHENVESPFANIESWRYPNGLQVYFKAMPKSEIVTFRMTLPVGGWHDPENRTGLAHFTEHMLFTGSKGYNKAEFEKLVDDRGGQNNASTTVKRTDYWLELPDHEWEFGIDWFGQLLFDHQFIEEHVKEERRAVILERDLKPETPLEIINRWFINPEWSRQKDEWTQMLGLEIPHQRLIGTWDDVRATETKDIQAFYDRYYGPQNMTIMLAGNFPRDKVKAYVDKHFASIEPHGEHIQTYAAAKPNFGERRQFNFSSRRGHVHELRHYIPDMDRNDVQWLWLLRTLLYNDLNTELRKNRQATYGVDVSFHIVQGHGRLISNGNFDPGFEEEAFAYIEKIYQQLREGTMPAEQFETLRKKVLDALLLDHHTPWSISGWVSSIFYDRNLMGDSIPDLYQFAKDATQEELASWMQSNIQNDLSITRTLRPSPIWPLANMGIMIAIILLSFSLGRRFLISPLDLHQHLYVRKVLYGPVVSILGCIAFICISFLLIQAMAVSAQYIQLHIVSSIDSFWLNTAWDMLLAALATIVILNIPARIPRKLILAPDHWRVKCLSYRSSIYAYEEIRDAQEKHLFQVMFSWKAFPCRIFHWGLFSKGLLIQLESSSYFIQTRENEDVIAELMRRKKAQYSDKNQGGTNTEKSEKKSTLYIAPAA
ncbi:M16 family metallopeptidase [Pseudoteredinibacter isoporae]|uniref:Putative Zn-dependent peptidase n=1 Tax=Pseudoteredinibacter isoporae TaxID=570281 RepID=A0A7X0MX67_9GAMM|nr:pitrilysin family protein [Pseudoteredinibacter isoporae]MBB6521734.1 putative Zn-dependent peptidase [Pseudoteredinibacter isoporae]NHO87282.1 insulinase family protein [Pseudoteredinibacter isoporae]NIB23086.1 insulinase family protein [Pseudoteredinibacter isoporae]